MSNNYSNNLKSMLSDSESLVIDGNLRTLEQWKEMYKDIDNPSQAETRQLKALFTHYQAFYKARDDKKALHKAQTVAKIADHLEVEL